MTTSSGKRFLLDTNIWIGYFRGDQLLKSAIEEQLLDIFLATPVLAELYYGAMNSSRKLENLSHVDRIKSRRNLVFVNDETAFLFGKLKASLTARGRMIPENDIWIAACAVQHGYVLVTRDRHFTELINDGLIVEAW